MSGIEDRGRDAAAEARAERPAPSPLRAALRRLTAWNWRLGLALLALGLFWIGLARTWLG